MKSRIVWPVILLLTGCAGKADFSPVNVAGDTPHFTGNNTKTPISKDDTLIALAFSGGGMRASAFSYGVVESMMQEKTADGKNLADKVDFVSGVSGGSVTAAYLALKGPEEFYHFREDFLDKNAEENLITDVTFSSLARVLTYGGANDRSAFPVWLDDHVFHGATYGDVMQKRRPVLWISASDVFNRTPFVFSDITFRPICSDLSKLKLADAVAASAAVPGAFTPINLESFAGQCDWQPASWVTKHDLYYSQKAILETFRRYRDVDNLRYIKLLDGGLTDNFGVQGVALTRLSAGEEYAPLAKERAIKLKRLLFLVVNSGRGPVNGEWNKRADNPSVVSLVNAVTDTAIDSNTRTTYDFFKSVMKQWHEDLVKWRCSLPKKEVNELLGADAKGWKCDNVQFYVSQISFEDTGENEARLDNIPTNFVLPKEDINFLIDSADVALKNNKMFNAFLDSKP